MKTLLHIAMVLCVFQVVIIDRNFGNGPAYVDPYYGIDGRTLQPQNDAMPYVIYDPIVKQNHSQNIWIIRPQGNNTATAERLIIDDD
jgi:hypothetical protein